MIKELLKEKGLVVIPEEIDEEKAIEAILKLISLHRELPDNESITLFICSGGGTCDVSLAIIDTIEQIKKEGRVVKAYCTGRVESMACYIALSCTKGERYTTPKTTFMVHDIHWNPEGSSIDIKNKYKSLEITNTHIKNLISNYSSEKLLELIETNTDRFLYAEEALELGIIDSIL
jgi:ATP-dependent Clp endopeptidase proteolytic subunit ClpP